MKRDEAIRHRAEGEPSGADGRSSDDTRPSESERRSGGNAWRVLKMWVPTIGLAALLTACPSSVGRLDVVIVGLPTGTDADVTVTGPESFVRDLTQSELLGRLAPGAYEVAAAPVGPYVAVAPDQDVDVVAGSRTEVDVIYQDTTSAFHECTPYSPTSLSVTDGDTWSAPDDVDTHSFTAPGDPGGGRITVRLGTNAPVEPWLTVTNASDPGGSIASAGASETENEQGRRTIFAAAPGQTYEAEVSEFFAAAPEEHPWPYVIGWSYAGVMDCYEPNDTFADAKYVPLDLVLEAYAIAGFRSNAVSDNAPHTYDWYRFELEADTHVELELLSAPANVEMNVRLFDAGGSQADSILPGRGNLFTRDFGVLTAGTWYLEFHPRPDARTADPFRGETTPEHLTSPYQFQLREAGP